MPKGRGKGRPFEKGNSLSKGRPPIPADVKAARKQFGDEFTIALYCAGKLSFDDIQIEANDRKLPGLNGLAVRWWARALNGSLEHAKAIVERLGSVVPKQVELTGAEGSPLLPPALDSFEGDSLTVAIVHLQKMVKETPCSSTPTPPPLQAPSQPSQALPSPSSSGTRS